MKSDLSGAEANGSHSLDDHRRARPHEADLDSWQSIGLELRLQRVKDRHFAAGVRRVFAAMTLVGVIVLASAACAEAYGRAGVLFYAVVIVAFAASRGRR